MLNFRKFMENSGSSGIKIVRSPEDERLQNLSIYGKEVGQINTAVGRGEKRVALAEFPQFVKPTDTIARIHGIQVDDDLQGYGLGQLLYLKGFDQPGIDWFYNSQTYPPATNTLKALAKKGYIELHWAPREPNWNEAGGIHIVRITPQGRAAYLTGKFLKRNALQKYWTEKGSQVKRYGDEGWEPS